MERADEETEGDNKKKKEKEKERKMGIKETAFLCSSLHLHALPRLQTSVFETCGFKSILQTLKHRG